MGKNNEFAYSTALAVAESPANVYNPLFLYGSSGLGKTHLMHAIGHYILKNYDNKKVLYVSSEMFTNELINALRNKEVGPFKRKYSDIDSYYKSHFSYGCFGKYFFAVKSYKISRS